jgi:hypothetical protein
MHVAKLLSLFPIVPSKFVVPGTKQSMIAMALGKQL